MKRRQSFKAYMKETWKNKVAALVLLFAALLSVILLQDATLMLLAAFVCGPLFTADENVVGPI